MTELARRFPKENGLKRRALNHAAREVLLAQASDWPFIMKSGIAAPFAAKQVKEHVANFLKIYNDLSGNSVDTEWLTNLERNNNLFPDIDYRTFRE
jgi:1,4-alpha-glucan branching enzyme